MRLGCQVQVPISVASYAGIRLATDMYFEAGVTSGSAADLPGASTPSAARSSSASVNTNSALSQRRRSSLPEQARLPVVHIFLDRAVRRRGILLGRAELDIVRNEDRRLVVEQPLERSGKRHRIEHIAVERLDRLQRGADLVAADGAQLDRCEGDTLEDGAASAKRLSAAPKRCRCARRRSRARPCSRGLQVPCRAR